MAPERAEARATGEVTQPSVSLGTDGNIDASPPATTATAAGWAIEMTPPAAASTRGSTTATPPPLSREFTSRRDRFAHPGSVRDSSPSLTGTPVGRHTRVTDAGTVSATEAGLTAAATGAATGGGAALATIGGGREVTAGTGTCLSSIVGRDRAAAGGAAGLSAISGAACCSGAAAGRNDPDGVKRLAVAIDNTPTSRERTRVGGGDAAGAAARGSARARSGVA